MPDQRRPSAARVGDVVYVAWQNALPRELGVGDRLVVATATLDTTSEHKVVFGSEMRLPYGLPPAGAQTNPRLGVSPLFPSGTLATVWESRAAETDGGTAGALMLDFGRPRSSSWGRVSAVIGRVQACAGTVLDRSKQSAGLAGTVWGAPNHLAGLAGTVLGCSEPLGRPGRHRSACSEPLGRPGRHRSGVLRTTWQAWQAPFGVVRTTWQAWRAPLFVVRSTRQGWLGRVFADGHSRRAGEGERRV